MDEINNFKNNIKANFLKFKNIEELVDVLNFSLKGYTGTKKAENEESKHKDVILIKKESIIFYLYGKKENYKSYIIPKRKPGKFRKIDAPKAGLKEIQQHLKVCFNTVFIPRKAAHGFIENRSIVTNAIKHVGKKFVYNIDLRDFFSSIHFGRVKAILKIPPFNFQDEQARILASLCCYNGILPQGAPTSPIITNIICRRLDSKLSQFAKRHRAHFTRYADDITLSCNKNIFTKKNKKEITRIVESVGLKINKDKVRLQNHLQRQMVTGLIVNKKLNVTPTYKKDLRFLINILKKSKEKGDNSAQEWLNIHYKNRHRYNGEVPEIEQVIEGKLNFFKMVVGENSSVYKKQLRAFEKSQKEPEDVTSFSRPDNQIGLVHQNRFLNNISEEFNIISLESLQKEIIQDPISLIDTDISQDIKLRDSGRYKKEIHNPELLAKVLGLFRETTHPFGKLTHGNSEKFENIDNEAKLIFKEIGEANNNLLTDKIPSELYFGIKRFLDKLGSDKNLKDFGHQEYKNVFLEVEPIISGFKRAIRFGIESDETKISNIIKYELVKLGKFSKIKISKKLDSTFQDVFTSVKNISAALSIIFSNCAKHGYDKLIKISVHKRNNKAVLRIIHIGSKPSKSINQLKSDLDKGNLQQIRSLLHGYCDFNIRATFKNNQHQKLIILPQVERSISENYTPEGFTYELLFYKPTRVLLIDDDKVRFEKIKQILIEREEFRNLIDITEKIEDEELDSYNGIFIHQSSEDYIKRVKNWVDENDTTIVKFSGGKAYNHLSDTNITLHDSEFYSLLVPFLNNLLISSKLSLKSFIELKAPSDFSTNSSRKILSDIGKGLLLLNSPICIELIKELVGNIIIPQFESRRQLKAFFDENK